MTVDFFRSCLWFSVKIALKIFLRFFHFHFFLPQIAQLNADCGCWYVSIADSRRFYCFIIAREAFSQFLRLFQSACIVRGPINCKLNYMQWKIECKCRLETERRRQNLRTSHLFYVLYSTCIGLQFKTKKKLLKIEINEKKHAKSVFKSLKTC